MYKKYPYHLLLLVFVIVQCKPETTKITTPPLPDHIQTVSLLGDSLESAPMREGVESLFSQPVIDAESKYRNDSTNIENIIWMGRRAAYYGDYRKAIRIYTYGLSLNPNDARLYRHRGHRYISTRNFDKAILDFGTAVALVQGKEDLVEQDGLPNAQNQPTSTLHTNIWYHLGLAHYLKGDYANAMKAYQKCITASENDDMLVAAVYWYYMTLKRAGEDDLAKNIIQPVNSNFRVIENESYLNLALLFKGELKPETLLNSGEDALSNATIAYGVGNWYYMNGDEDRAREIWQQVYDGGNWASFGFIASEAELAR